MQPSKANIITESGPHFRVRLYSVFFTRQNEKKDFKCSVWRSWLEIMFHTGFPGRKCFNTDKQTLLTTPGPWPVLISSRCVPSASKVGAGKFQSPNNPWVTNRERWRVESKERVGHIFGSDFTPFFLTRQNEKKRLQVFSLKVMTRNHNFTRDSQAESVSTQINRHFWPLLAHGPF